MSARHRNGKVQVNIDTRDHRSAHLGIEKLDMIKTDSEGVELGRGYTCSAMMPVKYLKFWLFAQYDALFEHRQ